MAEGSDVYCKTSDLPLLREAEVLSREANHDGGPVRALPFVSYDPQRNELVTEYVPGDNLFNVLWNGTSLVTGRAQPERLRDVVRQVAAWLAAFHRRSREYPIVGEVPAGPYGAGSVEAAVVDKLDHLTAVLPATSRNRELVAGLRRLARVLAAGPGWDGLAMSLIHADFTAGNVLAGRDGRVFVGDFADARTGFTLEDVVRFWSSIWEMAQCGRHRHAVFHPVLDDILIINGLPSASQHSAPFTLMREFNSVTKLLEVDSLRGRFGLGTQLVFRRIAAVHRRWLEQAVAPPIRRSRLED